MQSEVENISDTVRKVKVTVPQGEIQSEIDKRLKDLAKNANIKGFRKGKVPASVIQMQYGDGVRQEVIRDIVAKTLEKTCEEKNIVPVDMPEVAILDTKEDEPLKYEAKIEVLPEVKLNIEGISVEKISVNLTDKHIDDTITKLRHQNTEWQEVDRPAQKGDQVVIDFDGFMEGAPFKNGSAKDFRLELGQGKMIPGFEEPLYGLQAGNEQEVDVVFPENYPTQDFAGKPAKFKIKIHKVMEPNVPELTDAFAASLGVSKGTVAGLQEEVRNNLEHEIERRVRENLKAQIIEKLLEKNDIEVPKAAIEYETKRLQERFQKELSLQGMNKNISFERAELEEQARKNIIISLLLSQWIADNNIEVDATKVRSRVDQIASGYQHPHDIINWYYGNKEAMAEIEGTILEEQAIDKLLEEIPVTEKEISFEEFMGMQTR
jgi:trigger factor